MCSTYQEAIEVDRGCEHGVLDRVGGVRMLKQKSVGSDMSLTVVLWWLWVILLAIEVDWWAGLVIFCMCGFQLRVGVGANGAAAWLWFHGLK